MKTTEAYIACTAAFFAFMPAPSHADTCKPHKPCASVPVNLGALGPRPPEGSENNFGSLYRARGMGVSDNGKVVAGYGVYNFSDYWQNPFHAFIWQSGVLKDLGSLIGPEGGSWAFNVNRAGTIVVGESQVSSNDSYSRHAFQWTAQHGMVDLGALAGGDQSTAHAVSDDGSVIVGASSVFASSPQLAAVIWKSGGITQISPDQLGPYYSTATDVDGRGNVVVGVAADVLLRLHAFRWTRSTDVTWLAPGYDSSVATAVSRDGSVIVGAAGGYAPPEPFINFADGQQFHWTQRRGLAILGPGIARDVSDDGSVIVGQGFRSNGALFASRWTAATGLRDLNALLASAHVDMHGIVLVDASAVSGNGEVIAVNDQNLKGYIVRYLDAKDSHGRPIAGVTTPQSGQESAHHLVNSRRNCLIQQQAFARPWSTAHQYKLTDNLTLVARLNPTEGSDPEISTAFRYGQKLFAEIGAWTSPTETMTFKRSYANGSGLSSGLGVAEGQSSKAYVRGGIAFDQFSVSAEIDHDWLSIDGYAEPLSASNPFSAVTPASTDQMTSGKLRIEWAQALSSKADVGLWAAVAGSIHESVHVSTIVPQIAEFTASSLTTTRWVEYGAHGSLRLNPAVDAVFLAGAVSLPEETAVELRAQLRMRF